MIDLIGKFSQQAFRKIIQAHRDNDFSLTPYERHQRILEVVSIKHFVSLRELADMLDVTVMTIRRDIEQLSARGVIMSTRGGVKSRETPLRMPVERPGAHSLVRAALRYLGDSKVVYIDSGKLTFELATFFPYSDEMTIVTNDFAIAQHVMTHSSAALFLLVANSAVMTILFINALRLKPYRVSILKRRLSHRNHGVIKAFFIMMSTERLTMVQSSTQRENVSCWQITTLTAATRCTRCSH